MKSYESAGSSIACTRASLMQDEVVSVVAELLRTSEYKFDSPPDSRPYAQALHLLAMWCRLVLQQATTPVT